MCWGYGLDATEILILRLTLGYGPDKPPLYDDGRNTHLPLSLDRVPAAEPWHGSGRGLLA
jgi:hypothetical protein